MLIIEDVCNLKVSYKMTEIAGNQLGTLQCIQEFTSTLLRRAKDAGNGSKSALAHGSRNDRQRICVAHGAEHSHFEMKHPFLLTKDLTSERLTSQ